MSFRFGRVALMLTALTAFLAPSALAFFPIGGTDFYFLRTRPVTWPLSVMDTNGDRDVSGPNEGVPITLESGPLGFTNDEAAIVEAAFDVWENVPASFVGFTFTTPIPDPLDQQVQDQLNMVTIDVEGDQFPVVIGDVNTLGRTILTIAIEDTITTLVTGEQIYIKGGQIFEADIIINGPAHRATSPGEEPPVSLLGTMVHEIGHFVGLDHTPTENFFEFQTPDGLGDFVERPVVAQRDPFGQLSLVGATPTMFPFLFLVEGDIETNDGGEDLAPDDISGVSYLYPRGDQSAFFEVVHFARTQSSQVIPSVPLLGGLITAWADVENSPVAERVPLFSTITGLWEYPENIDLRGRFQLKGLTKQFEAIDGTPFRASYVLTITPLNGLDPAAMSPAELDSLHNQRPQDAWVGVSYNTFFPSEVFRETGGNIFDMSKVSLGTPLVYDPIRRKVVSADTGNDLKKILPGAMPMFGDAPTTGGCAIGAVYAGLPSKSGLTALRGFRDNILLKSPAGMALAEAYYRVTPVAANFLLTHARTLAGVRSVVGAMEWAAQHAKELLVLLIIGAVTLAVHRRKRARLAAMAVLAVCVCLAGTQASARMRAMTTPETVQASEDIVSGTVTSVETDWAGEGRHLESEITIDVKDTMKGRLNKNAPVQIRVLGGRKGGLVTYVPDLPTFEPGEEVVVFLRTTPDQQRTVVGGKRGKYQVVVDPATSEKTVRGSTADAQMDLPTDEAAAKDAVQADGAAQKKETSYDAFRKFVTDIVRKQEQAR